MERRNTSTIMEQDSHSSEDETNETESSDSQDDNPDDEPVLRQSKRIASNYGKALTERKCTLAERNPVIAAQIIRVPAT